MREFRSEMTAKPPPKTIKEVISAIIPPKGIKRGKNTEGAELFDGEEIGEDEEEIDADQLLVLALSGEISVEVVAEKENQKSNTVVGNSVSLVGIAASDQINKDAKFLDEIKKVLTNTRSQSSSLQLATNWRTLTKLHALR